MPLCFSGQNSRLFQIASHLSLTLRLSLIFREVRTRIGTALPVAIGAPIPFAELAAFADRRSLLKELRSRTYALAGLPAEAAISAAKTGKAGPLDYPGGARRQAQVPTRRPTALDQPRPR